MELISNIQKTNTCKQYLSTFIIDLYVFSFGLSLGWLSPITYLLRSDDSPLGEPITLEEMSWIGAVHLITALPGVIVYGYILNNYGRKTAACLVVIPFLVYWIIIIFADTVVYIIVARVFMGIGAGGVYTAIPVYIAEISEDKVRGRLGSTFIMSSYSGCLIAYAVCPRLPYDVIAYVFMVPLLIALICSIIFIPETSVFLMKKGNIKEATKTIRWLRGIEKNDERINQDVNLQLEKLRISCHIEAPRITYKDFLNATTLRGFLIGIILIIIQTCSTILPTMNFTAVIFEQAGSSLSPNDAAIIVGSLLLLGSFVSSYLVERAGRRILLMSSTSIVSLSLLSLGTFSYIKTTNIDVSSYGWVPVVSLSVCAFSYACGLGTLPIVVVSEIFAQNIRGVAVSICLFTFWFLGFLIVRFFNSIMEAIGMYGAYWLFGGSLIFGVAFIFFFLPETKGRSIDDIINEIGSQKKVMSVIKT